MPSGPRQLLQDRFTQVADDLEQLFADARERTRREYAEQLNQCVRRLRQAPDTDELAAVLGDAAALFASESLVFRIESGIAKSPQIEVPLTEAPALASAVDMREPLVALAAPAEVSAPVVALLAHDESARVHLFPILSGDDVPALIYCWGTVQSPAIELLTQVTGAVWNALAASESEPEPAPVPAAAAEPELITIAVAAAAEPEPAAAPAKPASSWEELAPAEQQMHLRAQRFARVHVAEMRLHYADAVQSGRTRRNLYDALREPIDTAREAYRKQFFNCSSMVDYLDLELTRTLAHDNPELLGQHYPGPLV
jgi:hypothetical protein